VKTGKVYALDWLDHCEDSSGPVWVDPAKIDTKAVLIRSVGFVIRLTDETVVIAHTLHGGESSSPFMIVRSAIVAETEIELPPLRRPARTKKLRQ